MAALFFRQLGRGVDAKPLQGRGHCCTTIVLITFQGLPVLAPLPLDGPHFCFCFWGAGGCLHAQFTQVLRVFISLKGRPCPRCP